MNLINREKQKIIQRREIGLIFTIENLCFMYLNFLTIFIVSKYKYFILIITDLSGNTLYSSGDYNSNAKITIGQNLPSGMYILEVKSDFEEKTLKIIKINQ